MPPLFVIRPRHHQRIRRLREERGVGQAELARGIHRTKQYLSTLENDKAGGMGLETAARIADFLNITIDAVYGRGGENEPKVQTKMSFLSKKAVAIFDEMGGILESLDLVEIPVRGTLPSDLPFPREQKEGETVEVPRQYLGNANPQNVYAVIKQTDSLIGDFIFPGDAILINAVETDIEDGKIYAVEYENHVTGRHVFHEGDKLRLVDSRFEFSIVPEKDVKIKGRIIASGRWKKHT